MRAPQGAAAFAALYCKGQSESDASHQAIWRRGRTRTVSEVGVYDSTELASRYVVVRPPAKCLWKVTNSPLLTFASCLIPGRRKMWRTTLMRSDSVGAERVTKSGPR